MKRTCVVLEDLGFDFISSVKITPQITILSGRGPQADKVHLKIEFNPPLSPEVARQTSIRLYHPSLKTTHFQFIVYNLHYLKEPFVSVLMDSTYHSFPSHTLRVWEGNYDILYLSMQNVQLDGSDNASPQYAPLFSISHPRYQSLAFFPPDPSINVPLSIKASEIPQDIPQWFKLRGEVTGSLIPELLGYFVPEWGTPEADGYEIGQRKDFSGWKGVNVRFGKINEDIAVLCLLESNPDLNFKECGYFEYPSASGERAGEWGASPDGLLYDPNVATRIPPSVLEQFPGRQPELGVCEIKSSRWNCDFSGYYVPQCIWEMMCADTLWCNLVRYSENKVYDKKRRIWTIQKQCRKVCLYRQRELETMVTNCVIQSLRARTHGPLGGKEVFLKLVYSQPFIDLRATFDAIAASSNVRHDVIPVNEELIERIQQERKQYMTASVTADIPALHPAIDRIEARTAQIFQLYQEPKLKKQRELTEAICEQVDDYMELIKSTL
jgi:hypothetical protein